MGTGNSVRAQRRKYGSQMIYILNILRGTGMRVTFEKGVPVCENKNNG